MSVFLSNTAVMLAEINLDQWGKVLGNFQNIISAFLWIPLVGCALRLRCVRTARLPLLIGTWCWALASFWVFLVSLFRERISQWQTERGLTLSEFYAWKSMPSLTLGIISGISFVIAAVLMIRRRSVTSTAVKKMAQTT